MRATRRYRRAALLWVLAFLGVLVIAVAVVTTVNARGYGPEQAVRAYLSALRDGDGAGALGMLGAAVPPGDPTLLTGDPLRRSVESLSDVELSVTSRTGDDATVTARYRLDGRTDSTAFPVRRTGSSWIFFDRWELTGSTLPRTTVSFPGQDRARVNGAIVAAPGGRATLLSFAPARVTAGWSGKLMQAPERGTSVTGLDDNRSVALQARPTTAMVTAVRDQLRRVLDRCAGQRVLAPAGCPFYHFSDKAITGPVTWRITRYPEPTIAFRAGAWRVQPLTGRAELTTRETDLFSGVETELRAAQDFSFTAELEVTGDVVTVRPRVAGPETTG